MKTKNRFIKSVIETSKTETPALPWARRRTEAAAKRAAAQAPRAQRA